jgi:hypothetical protein
MPLTILPSEQQAPGSFDGGRILERKPIGFPGEGGLSPYSNLFYWAHAWSDPGGLIAEHPHRGFDIMSYVVKGEIEHYDSQFKGWKKLKAGDAQVIRSGNGITHAEKILPGGAIFQIWFDPDLNKTLSIPASYNDYSSDRFPVKKNGGVTVKQIAGGDSPFRIHAPGIVIREIKYPAGKHTLARTTASVVSAFLIEGSMNVNGNDLAKGDFFLADGDESITLKTSSPSVLFVLETPLKPGYSTYAEMNMR